MRQQADTPWFKSVLTYDPAKVVPKVKQPMLIIHGDLDPAVPATEADRLAELARAPQEVVAARGRCVLLTVGQALTPTGETRSARQVAAAIAEWIKKL